MSNPRAGRTPAPPGKRGRARHAALAHSERPARASGEPPRAGPEGPIALIEVDASEPAEHLFRRLLSAYLGGGAVFEVVEIPRLSSGTREVVREFCRRTLRPVVVAEDAQRLRLADQGPEEGEPLDARLLHLGALVLAFHREAVESWSDLPLGADGRWAERDDDIDREAWYLERCLARNEGRPASSSPPVTAAWTIARSLERIGDHAVTLGEVGPRLAEFGPEVSPVRELRQFHHQAMAHLEAVLQAPEGTRANELLDVGEALVASGRGLTERLLPAVGDGSMAPATAAAVARALEAVSRTVAYSQDIAQAFFDRAQRAPGGPGPGASATVAVPAG